jgi:hypothetical protein
MITQVLMALCEMLIYGGTTTVKESKCSTCKCSGSSVAFFSYLVQFIF